jgi:hypothetical protein
MAGHAGADLLHVDDLVELIDEQLADPGRWEGVTVDVGGAPEISLSCGRRPSCVASSPAAPSPSGRRPRATGGRVRIYISTADGSTGLPTGDPDETHERSSPAARVAHRS